MKRKFLRDTQPTSHLEDVSAPSGAQYATESIFSSSFDNIQVLNNVFLTEMKIMMMTSLSPAL